MHSCLSQWRHYHYSQHHNGCDGISNYQPHDCFLNRLFGRRSKKTSKLCVTGPCVGNSPGTGEFPAQRASNAENVSIWWRHHDSDSTWVSLTHGISNHLNCLFKSLLRQQHRKYQCSTLLALYEGNPWMMGGWWWLKDNEGAVPCHDIIMINAA